MNSIHEAWKVEKAARVEEPCAEATLKSPLMVQADSSAVKQRIAAVVRSSAIKRRTLNAAKAVEWLTDLGVKVLDVKVDPLAAVVRVAYTPFLARIFANDCTWLEQRQEGNATIFVWFALRCSARIEWEEVQPCAHA